MSPVAAWEPLLEDRLAEVEHADRRRRPLRAASAAIGALVAELAVVPELRPWMAPLLGGSAVAVGFAAWYLPRVRGGRPPALGARAFRLEVGPRVRLYRDAVEHDLLPSAIRRLFVASDHVFVHLADGEIVAVPCRVLSAPGEVDRFVLALESFRKSGTRVHADGAAAPWVLRFRADGPARDELRPLARGTLVAAFGPEGGRIDGPDGTWRFPWSAVRRLEDRDGFAFALADRAVFVPPAAFDSGEALARFRADVERWWAGARPVPAPRAPGPPVEPEANPYAAPR